MQRLLLLGLNHATAPLPLREKLAFTGDGCARAIAAFAARFPEAELVLLSTCNRVELYTARAVHGHPRVEEMIDFLSSFHGIEAATLRPHVYEKSDRAVVEHLFRVSASLDSMVLGETQILGQVRSAYDLAAQQQSAGAMLHPLFQRAVAVGKQVLTQTSLAEGRTSVASVAVDYARRIFETFNDKNVLAIGAGKMGLLVLRHLAELKPKHIAVCSRDSAKATQAAAAFNGHGVGFERMAEALVSADIVVCSTASPQPILTRKTFEPIARARRYRPIFLIDIALPRDVAAEVGDINGVYLYNIDDLQQVVAGTRDTRREAVEAAEKLVAAAVDEYAAWHRSREMGPIIERLYQRYHRLAQDEVARTLNKLPNVSDDERQHLEELARRIVNKLLNSPVQMLRRSGSLHLPTAQYLHAMEKLFELDTEGGTTGDPETPDEPRSGGA